MNDCIARVIDEASEAVRDRMRLNRKASETLGIPFDVGETKKIDRQLRAYERQLRSLRKAAVSKGKPQVDDAIKRICEGYAPRLLATVRATLSDRSLLPYSKLEEQANNLSLSKAYHETVAVVPAPGTPGSWRSIALSGMRRKAQQFILRDILLVTMGESTCDSTVPGAGGEVQLFKEIKSAIADGYHYWVSLDIRNFFPSLRPGHLKEFPLYKWVIRNLVFLPSDAPIRFIDRQCGLVLSEQAVLQGDGSDLPPHYPYSWDSIGAKLKKVRQGLLQGDVCAPQIARTVLGRELQLALEEYDVVYGSYVDDVLLGARTHTELKTSIQALAYRLQSHPAGPLELHEHEIRHISDAFCYLGNKVSLRKNGEVHVNPATKRFDRFRGRLDEKFAKSAAFSREALLKVGTKYAADWYDAQKAWTKTGSSRKYVLGEVDQHLNQFIYEEFMAAIGGWSEADIDFDQIEEW